MSKRELLSYIKTFFITLSLITLSIVVIVLVTKDSSEEAPTAFELKEYKQSQTELLIEQYKYQEKIHDKNFAINVKLGLVYESIAKLKEAEAEYKKAIKKAPYGNFEPTFLLASLYTEESKFSKALALVDQIREYPNPSLISSKAIFYSKIAQKLYEKHYYADSIRQYLNSYYYQEKNNYYKTDVLRDLPKVYAALANQYVANNKTDKAIRLLGEGIRITKSTQLMYQLGVISMNTNPERSLELFEYVALENPTIINYNTYNHLLMILIRKAENNSDSISLKGYIQKLKIVTRFAEYNIIEQYDFQLKSVKVKYKKYPFKIGEYAEIEFAIRNNTSCDVSKLYAQIRIYNNNKLVKEVEKRIATTGNVIKRGRNSQLISVKARFIEGNDFIITDNVKAEILIKRNERLKRTQLGEILIPKK